MFGAPQEWSVLAAVFRQLMLLAVPANRKLARSLPSIRWVRIQCQIGAGLILNTVREKSFMLTELNELQGVAESRCEFEEGQIVGARLAGASVIKTAGMLGFSRAAVDRTMRAFMLRGD